MVQLSHPCITTGKTIALTIWTFVGISDSVDMNLSKLWEMVKDRRAWHAAVHRVTKSQTQLRD